MRIGSLFSGIGGLEMGLELALDGEVIWQVEFDDYARQVLEKHWPGADRSVRDIRQAKDLQHVDLLCGGFPCQGLSVAGKGEGLKDQRSGLWFEMLRVIREIRPPIVVLENVPAIRTRGLDTVLAGLASLGYDAQWGVFGAADVGAPHRRQRWYCIAYLPDAIGTDLWLQQRRSSRKGGENKTQSQFDGATRDVAHPDSIRRTEIPNQLTCQGHPMRRPDKQKGRDTQAMAHPEGQRPSIGQRQRRDAQQELPTTLRTGGRSAEGNAQRRLGGAAHGIPPWIYQGNEVEPWENGIPRAVPKGTDLHRVNRLRCLGNSVVPMWAYWVGMKVLDIVKEKNNGTV